MLDLFAGSGSGFRCRSALCLFVLDLSDFGTQRKILHAPTTYTYCVYSQDRFSLLTYIYNFFIIIFQEYISHPPQRPAV